MEYTTALVVALLLATAPVFGGAGPNAGAHDTQQAQKTAGAKTSEGQRAATQHVGKDAGAYNRVNGHYGNGAIGNSNHNWHYVGQMLKGGNALSDPFHRETIASPLNFVAPSIDPTPRMQLEGQQKAAPATGPAPWETGIARSLIEMDRPHPYAERAAGIQDAYGADYAKALPELRKAIDSGQHDGTALSFGALAAFHQNDMRTAKSWAKESLAAEPGGPWAKLADSVSHLVDDHIGEHEMPTAKLQKAPGEDGLAPGAVGAQLLPKAGPNVTYKGSKGLLEDAEGAMAMKDYGRAEKLAGTALFMDPTSAEALRLRAEALLREGDYRAALAEAEKGLALEPGSASLLEEQALASGRLGDYEQARKDAFALLALDPNNVKALRLLAFAEAGLGNRAGMVAALERAAALDAASVELLRQARSLPAEADAVGLFTDALLLGDAVGPAPTGGAGSAAGGAWGAMTPLKAALAVGGGVLMGLGLALAAMAASRRRKTGRPGALDLSEFGRRPAQRPATLVSGDPSQLGPFRILGKLGAGGMGVVYKAEDTRLGRLVALKRMREEIASDPAERKRFLKEARIVSALRHPGIVSIFSIHDDPSGPYLVFELVPGRTLAETLKARGPLPLAEARAVLEQASEAVAYAHSQGVVHRDLKPSNIMLDEAGRVRVMDFGVARAAKDAVSRLTALGSGTPAYMAPEQEDGGGEVASDVYALGVCLYEMLAGRRPFQGRGLALYEEKRACRFAPLGAPVDGVIAIALDPHPERRFPSPRELAAALGAVTA